MRYPLYNKLTSQDICVPIKHIYYIKDWNGLPVRISLSLIHTSSMRSLALPISSGMDSSLLLLTTRTRSGRLNRNLGSTDSWFRLENITAHTFHQLFTSGAQIILQADGTQHKIFTKCVSSVNLRKFRRMGVSLSVLLLRFWRESGRHDRQNMLALVCSKYVKTWPLQKCYFYCRLCTNLTITFLM